MKTYLVGSFFYRIIKAENPTKAWITYISEDIPIVEVFWSREEVRQELLKRGFRKIQVTNTDIVFEVLK